LYIVTAGGIMAQITITVDKKLKKQAENYFASLGTTISDALNNHLSNTVKGNTNPLPAIEKPKKAKTKDKDKKKKEKTPKTGMRAIYGSLKGKITIPDDFDEPLECFKDYM
jgi:antitoxin component of RelBE/YafQ-DinJ toxin-antitoxin module